MKTNNFHLLIYYLVAKKVRSVYVCIFINMFPSPFISWI